MSSKIARPNSTQSMVRTKSLNVDPFVCHRVDSPIKKQSDLAIKVGQKVYVSSLSLSGTVKFVGGTKFKPNEMWVGIELDNKGAGKNDGRIQGVRYFSCSPNSGLFVMASKVKVIEQAKPTRSISRSPTMPLKPNKSTRTATMKATKSTATPHTLKPTKSTVMPFPSKTTRTADNSLKATKSSATPHLHRSSRPTATPKPTKSAVTVGTLKSTKSTVTSGTLKSSMVTKPMRPTAVLRTSTSITPRPKSTPPGPRQSQSVSPSARPTIQRAQSGSPRREQAKEDAESPAPKMVRSQTEPDDIVASLLSAKESYALQVQEKNREIVSLKQALETSQTMQHRLARETEAAHARASLKVQTEHHVDRLEQRVQGLLKERVEAQQKHELERREWAAYEDQLRKQLSDRDHAMATLEKEYATLRISNEDLIRSYERAITEMKEKERSERKTWEARQEALQNMVDSLRQERFWPAEVQDKVPNAHQRLEDQLELTTQELDRERESIQRLMVDHSQLKKEIKRLNALSTSSQQESERLNSMLEKEVSEKRRLMEENDAALEAQTRLEEENEQIRLSHGKAQHDLAEMLKRLATLDKNNQGAHKVSLMAHLRAENERLLEAQKHLEQECMSLMDELVSLGNCENKGIEPGHGEIERLKTQVGRERRRHEDMERALELKLERLSKELVDLESLVENKVFNEAELEERLETERKRVRQLESKLKETERMAMIPTPTSPSYPSNLLSENYCEICEVAGHDLMLCTTLNDLSVGQSKSRNSYCVNCDVFDTHPTEQCPNQDETF